MRWALAWSFYDDVIVPVSRREIHEPFVVSGQAVTSADSFRDEETAPRSLFDVN